MRQAPAHQLEWSDQWSDHIFILHALKVGTAGVLALFVAQALRLQYPEWYVFTVMTLNMGHYYPGSVALKALFHSLGTLVGASLGVWLVSDYLSAPVLFLSVTFLVMFFASCKVGHLIRIVVVDNQHVQRGDLLFEIDPADYRAAVEQERAQVLAATAASTQKKQELDISEGAYASAGQQVMALVDSDSYWVAGYFKETQLRHISTGDTATISLMGNEDLPFRGTVRSVGWGIFVTDGSSGENTLLPSVEGTALLPSVSPTIDWVRLPQRFPVRIQVDSSATGRLRIGQTASVAISHGARTESTRIIP